MGFYGNITNTSRTQFQFDKRYANRRDMDAAASTDGIYIGRYVLIEYDTPVSGDFYKSLYRDAEKHFYTSPNAEKLTEVRISKDIYKGVIIQVPKGRDKDGYPYNLENPDTEYTELWQCNNENNGQTPPPVATFTLLSNDADSDYVKNYAIDTETYGKGRGYDSTVWQKTYLDGKEKYVMIAELNTVVPTFDISADAPTEMPITPHFDTDSTNVYYKLHWQPQWGFRIKGADSTLETPRISSTGDETSVYTSASLSEKDYPSDESIYWTRTWYDKKNNLKTNYIFNYPKNEQDGYENTKGTWVSENSNNDKTITKTPAAIYYNKDGFSADSIAYSSDNVYAGWGSNGVGGHVTDEISLSATGQSGFDYPVHDGTRDVKPQADTQELSIILPSLGDSMAKIWNLIYGDENANASYNDQLGNNDKTDDKGNVILGRKRNKNINWCNALSIEDKEGLRLVKRTDEGHFTYNTDQVDTIAGAINSVHDLMGMIIVNGVNKPANGELSTSTSGIVWEDPEATDENGNNLLQKQIDSLNEEFIYYKDRKYYRKHKAYIFTPAAAGSTSYTPVELKEWKFNAKSPLYYKDSDSTMHPSYILDKIYYPDREYVQNVKSGTKVQLGAEYEPKKYYSTTELSKNGGTYLSFQVNDNGYQGAASENSVGYYSIEKETNLSYRKVYFYDANTYYYKDGNEYVLDSSVSMGDTRQYYIKEDGGYVAISLENTEYFSGSSGQPCHSYYYINDGGKYTITTEWDSASKETSLKEGLTPTNHQYYERYCIYYPGFYYYAEYSKVKKITEEEFKAKGSLYYIAAKIKSDTHGNEIVVDGKVATEWKPDTSYYTLNYVKDNNSIPKDGYNYYIVQTQQQGEGSSGYYITLTVFTEVSLTKATYTPGVYYKKSGDTYVLDEDEFDKGETYYKQETQYQQVTSTNIVDISTAERVKMMTFNTASSSSEKDKIEAAYFYKIEDSRYAGKIAYTQVNSFNYTPIVDDIQKHSRVFYSLALSQLEDIYEKNIYYYRYLDEKKELGIDRNGSYLLSTGDWSKDREYYLNIVSKPVTDKFYYPYKYYYKDIDGEYKLATGEYGQDNNGNALNPIQYYDENAYYVISDTKNIYQPGAKWNSNADKPASVTLGTRTEKWELQELKEFAYHMNTIHGLILKIHELLEDSDKYTRDSRTVQGCINLLNDMIARFDKMVPGQLTLIDTYGRLHSTPTTTSEDFYTTNGQISIGKQNTKVTSENRFVDLNINPDPINPKITIKHNFTSVANTTTVADKNKVLTAATGYTALGNNNSNDDTLKLYTPIVDNKGHVVGSNTETVTLPYGFKYFDVTGSSGAVTNPSVSTLIISADNSKDTLNIQSANKWLRINATEKVDGTGNDVLTFGHEVHSIDTTPITSDLNNNNTNTIAFQDLVFDEAGHVTKNQKHTYVLPYSYKSIAIGAVSTATSDATSNTTTITADNTQDTFEIAAANKWIRLSAAEKTDAVGNDIITIGHQVNAIDTVASTATDLNDGTNTITLYDTTYDAAGHFTAKKAHQYTLPYGFKQFNSDNSTVATGVTGNTASIIATNTQDILSLKGGNKWININATDKIFTFGHVLSSLTAEKHSNSNESSLTPSFGSQFNIPIYTTDEAGHVTAFTTETITLPIGSLTNTAAKTDSNIVTEIGFIPTSGKITVNRTDIGALTLNGFTSSALSTNTAITTSDTLNSALNKLENQIKNSANTINEALTQEVKDRETAINQEVKDRNNAIETAILEEVTDRNNAISDAIIELSEDTETPAGYYITEVTQSNGVITKTSAPLLAAEEEVKTQIDETDVPVEDEVTKISYLAKVALDENNSLKFTTEVLPDYITVDKEFKYTTVNEETQEETTETLTLTELMNKVFELSTLCTKLEARIEALENTSTE